MLLWAYCRVSTQKSEQELSLEEQVLWAQEYARKQGAALVVFRERASAKTIIRRPECARMFRELGSIAPKNRPQVLIATSFDRLSRDMTDMLLMARDLREAKVQLYIRDRGIIAMDSFADQASLVGQAMGGHAENDAKSNRARASWERRRREGKPTSNKVPYGLQLENEFDVPAEGSADWVRMAFEWYAAGIGMHRIAQRLKLEAPPHVTKTTRVGPDGKIITRVRNPVWEENRVRKLLVQRRYRGTIVAEVLFDTVSAILDQKPHWRNDRKFEYPLSGAIKCAGCGRSFHGHATGANYYKKRANNERVRVTRPKRTRYYACTVCSYRINANTLEAWFFRDVGELAGDSGLVRAFLSDEAPRQDGQSVAKELTRIRSQLEACAGKRRRAWQASQSGDEYVVADLSRELKSIVEEEADLRDRLGRLEETSSEALQSRRTIEKAKTSIKHFWKNYNTATYEQKRELASSIVSALGGATATKGGLVWARMRKLSAVS